MWPRSSAGSSLLGPKRRRPSAPASQAELVSFPSSAPRDTIARMGRGGLLGSPFVPPKETHPSPLLQGVQHDLACWVGGCCLKLPLILRCSQTETPGPGAPAPLPPAEVGLGASDAPGGRGVLLVFLVVLRRLILGWPGPCLAPQQADGLRKPGVSCLGPQQGCCPPWPRGLLIAWGQLGSSVQVTVALRQRGQNVGRGEGGGGGHARQGSRGSSPEPQGWRLSTF